MMDDQELELNGFSAAASGILDCLRMLADEAAELHLDGTLRALRAAIAVCQTERGTACPGEPHDVSVPPEASIH